MVAGALIQIISSIGEQDLYLTGDPQISIFKTVYKRHTNFAVETISEIFNNACDFGKTARCVIPRRGDLLSNIALEINIGSLNPEFTDQVALGSNILHMASADCVCSNCLKSLLADNVNYGWANALGHVLIESSWIEIGGRKIDEQYGEWLEIWSELTQTQEKRMGYNQMIGKVDYPAFKATTFPGSANLYVPLNFWFCKNYGLALPIVALYYQDVELVVKFREFEGCWVSTTAGIAAPKRPKFDARILIDNIYLGLDERRQFYTQSNIYLIEQHQNHSDDEIRSTTANINLYFNHPVKEIIWLLQRSDVTGPANGVYSTSGYPIGNDWYNYSTFPNRNTGIIQDTFEYGKILVNGSDRFSAQRAAYFRLLQPYYYHTRIPTNYIYTYSFSLKPEELQPTGQLNFSMVENVKILLSMPRDLSIAEQVSYIFRAYVVNYNVLYITSGMGSLLFNNR